MAPNHPPDPDGPDNGLRTMLTWTFVALVGALVFSSVAVYLVTKWFG